ncbi:hypothetical protein [Haloprofundus halobius]|uniref:hypothetical protein n=1 Tax=Haloprofundus halobius TaxID=2876194 RepID=UPI001CCDBFED|nr:hypothetical protein [Haloprofundus halobius]
MFRRDERGQMSYQLMIALITIVIVGATLVWVAPLFSTLQDNAEDRNEDVRYSVEAEEGLGYIVQAQDGMPTVTMVLVALFVFGAAVYQSARGGA